MHILYEINTSPITYPIDAHRRQRLIPVLSHALHGHVVKSGPSSIFPIFLLFFLILLAHILPFVTLLLLVCHLTLPITNDRILS